MMKTMLKEAPAYNESFFERITDANRSPLHPDFVEFIYHTADLNIKTPTEIWQLWKAYSLQCQGMDQSPVKSEFLDWNGLKTTMP